MTGFFSSKIVNEPKLDIPMFSGDSKIKTNTNDKNSAQIYINKLYGPYQPHTRLEQRGIVRSNCIDCVDRTNVAQVRKIFKLVRIWIKSTRFNALHSWNHQS